MNRLAQPFTSSQRCRARLAQVVVGMCLWAASACSAETRTEPPGSIVNVWATSPPRSEQLLPGFEEAALFQRVAARIEERFVMPYNLYVSHRPCGSVNAFYDPMEARIRMCDELFEHVVDVVRGEPMHSDAEVREQVSSTWVWMFLHEVGHAFIDMFDVPVLGNEEYAVDEFAAILLIQAGESNMARLAAGYWAEQANNGDTDYADEHGLSMQRYYTELCLVYGSDPDAHADIVEQGLLSTDRSGRCVMQYQMLLKSWVSLLGDRLKDPPMLGGVDTQP